MNGLKPLENIIDQFKLDLQSEHHDLFQQAPECLLSFEGVREARKPRITTYSHNNSGICHLRSMSDGIDIEFLKGTKFIDTSGRLTGESRAIRLLSLRRSERRTVTYYLLQALAVT